MPDTEGQQIEDDEIKAPATATPDTGGAASNDDSDDVEGHTLKISSEWDVEGKSVG